jgi:hypothetical protein
VLWLSSGILWSRIVYDSLCSFLNRREIGLHRIIISGSQHKLIGLKNEHYIEISPGLGIGKPPVIRIVMIVERTIKTCLSPWNYYENFYSDIEVMMNLSSFAP